MSNVIS